MSESWDDREDCAGYLNWEDCDKYYISRTGTIKSPTNNSTYAEVECSICGLTCFQAIYHTQPAFCSSQCFGAYTAAKAHLRNGIRPEFLNHPLKDKSFSLYCAARYRAKKRKIPFTLTEQFVLDKLIIGICEWSKIPFDLEVSGHGAEKMFSPSIDEIVPGKGYTPENCWMILNCLNTFKNLGSLEDALIVAEAAANFRKEQHAI